jgi:hypothetical protein
VPEQLLLPDPLVPVSSLPPAPPPAEPLVLVSSALPPDPLVPDPFVLVASPPEALPGALALVSSATLPPASVACGSLDAGRPDPPGDLPDLCANELLEPDPPDNELLDWRVPDPRGPDPPDLDPLDPEGPDRSAAASAIARVSRRSAGPAAGRGSL